MIIKGTLEKCIEDINDKSALIVLKGFDINQFDCNFSVDINDLFNNKLAYFMKIASARKNIVIYDEYLALYEILNMQYKKIYIINNNLYIRLFPLTIKLNENILNGMINHFDEEKLGDKFEIGDINDYLDVYSNIKIINNNYFITYNNVIINEKEENIDLFNSYNSELTTKKITNPEYVHAISNEEDYLKFLNNCLLLQPNDIIYDLKSTTVNKNIIIEKIKILNQILKGKTNIVQYISNKDKSVLSDKEYERILKKYWGYSTFRPIKTYDLDLLQDGKKEVKEILQSEIIDSIVKETEKCIKKKDYSDIFVTASTGAGKSVMFQIPAIYLAEKYELFTIVISPLIGLMKDQVNNLDLKNYSYARTINSDITPIQKQEIINDIADKKCHILYMSPESLLSKSDLEQIIGNRTLGLLVVDEAHIVTTWGKQFRPDYWYLGDHLNKIKKAQLKNTNKGMGFVIATFTATAIYGGIENMYEETTQSLNMVEPITYLGYVKRDDVNINVITQKEIKARNEYELNKFDDLIDKIDQALVRNQKMLIYFPTVKLIDRFYDYCRINSLDEYISRYHGQLEAVEKEENYRKFLNKETPIMIATKAFGMGIDINDIEIVSHFAPTGNVCDYVQEIGRGARRSDLTSEAYYKFMSNDFKHINRLHGLSTIKEYQLVEVIKKVYELHQENIKNNQKGKFTKKRNEMLVDAENFSHIFENPFFNEDDGINKVKTAMLLIQKDFERTYTFSPFTVRPIPLFETGYFQINKDTQSILINKYGKILNEIDNEMNICSISLKSIWEKDFSSLYSFPKFKYMLYTKDNKLNFPMMRFMNPALSVEITLKENFQDSFYKIILALKEIIKQSIREQTYYKIEGENGLVEILKNRLKINIYKSKSIVENILSAMAIYQRDYNNNLNSKVYKVRPLKNGDVTYNFLNGSISFFNWLEKQYTNIVNSIKDNKIYFIDSTGNNYFKEKMIILGILETLDILVFKALGGKNSQIYIYVNETKTMKGIIKQPRKYKNNLIELISQRHEVSVEMLTYIYTGNFSSEEIWNLIENYFLGVIPKEVIKSYENKSGKKLEVYNNN